MKRYLLFVIAFVCVSIGAWAGPLEGFELKKEQIGTWFFNNDASLGTEKVIKVEVSKTGGLKAALDELTRILNGQARPDYLDKLNETANNSSNFVSEKKLVLQVVNTSGNALTLNDDDLAALASIDIPTIDLQDLNPASTFTFVNPNVKRVILPDGWDKADVNAFGEALKTSTNFESAYSINALNGTDYTLDATSGSIVAYVNKPGTLYTAIRHIYGQHVVVNNNPVSHTKLGTADAYTFGLNKLKYITLLGTPSAHDFNGGDAEAIKYDAEGHFVFDREADETKTDKDAGIGGTRQLLGTHKTGAIIGAQLAYLNLGDAIITDEHCSDLTISWSHSAQSSTLKWIVFPTTPRLTTLPADCLNGDYALLEEFCIPGNIEVLKTRACYISTQVVRHIWTTGTKSGVMYDNGAYLVNYDPNDPTKNTPGTLDHYGHAPLSSTTWNNGCGNNNIPDVGRFGTITLPENLRLIESNCFTSRNVSDVYSLNPVAPECHVDAFSTIMYLGNNTIDTDYIIKMGMVTREAYAQDVAKGEYITFLHYPPTIGTPEIQRYTDPTREFSVATTLRDGKGNIIYFPNQSELDRAYLQGTTGYLWYAWDSKRVPEGPGNANSFYDGKGSFHPTLNGHTTSLQESANSLYENNLMTNPDKTDRSFYDVRLDTDGQPTLAQPDGLDWYYNTRWEGVQLYPQPTKVSVVDDQGNPVMVTVPVTDENGNIIYDELPSGSSTEGNYTRATEQRYYRAINGTFCHPLNQDQNGLFTIDYSYTQNEEGLYCKAPWDNNVWTTWSSWMGNIQRYDRAVSGIIEFDNQQHNDGRPRFNIGTDYVDYASYNSEYKQFLDRYNVKDVFVYSPANEGDPEPYYKMRTQVVQDQVVTEKKDYRGWHQFVLAAYGPAGDPKDETVVKFYQTDSDWWTVCLPYDLTHSEMIRFFGNESQNKIPYLSKLRYVVRDYDKRKITLMFSNNLMVYKENITGENVHGDIDDKTKWTDGEIEQDPIILHKGVPYLIKPEIPVGANRSFSVAKEMNADLYQRLVDAENVGGGALETYIYKGEYTVPAYVVGTNAPEETVAQRTFDHYGDYSKTYYSANKIKYEGQEVEAKISNQYSYTFIGSFFKSVLPHDCYFLGWDNVRQRAAFWYNKTPKLDAQEWNNQTGIICANFDRLGTLIDPATSLNDPARWIFAAESNDSDNLLGTASSAPKSYGMGYGGAINIVNDPENPLAEDFGDQEVLSIDEIQSLDTKSVWYNVSGQKLNGRPTQSGVYIMNGKKYVVK